MDQHLAVIPARYESKRFPGKALALLQGRTLLASTIAAVRRHTPAAQLLVAAADERIAAEARRCAANTAVINDHAVPDIRCGLDRVAEAAQGHTAQFVLHVQVDEPWIEPGDLDALLALLEHGAPMATLAAPWPARALASDPDCVKVWLDRRGIARCFARHPSAFLDRLLGPPLLHLGVYGYRRETLAALRAVGATALEQAAGLEQLRARQAGVDIHCAVVPYRGRAINRPPDIPHPAAVGGGYAGRATP